MSALYNHVYNYCDAAKMNVRVREIHTESVHILDIASWDEGHVKNLRRRFPHLHARAETCSHSLSGFRVVLTSQRETLEWAWLVLTGVGLAVYVYLLVQWIIVPS